MTLIISLDDSVCGLASLPSRPDSSSDLALIPRGGAGKRPERALPWDYLPRICLDATCHVVLGATGSLPASEENYRMYMCNGPQAAVILTMGLTVIYYLGLLC